MNKEQRQEEILKKLYAKIDNNELLDAYEKGVFDTLSWLVDDADEPEIED
jgi:hypothetical protein